MIKLDNFDYYQLRKEYLLKISEAGIVGFDKEDIIQNGESQPLNYDSSYKDTQSKTKKTYDKLFSSESSSTYIKKFREYLFPDGERLCRNHLQQLLAGPEKDPREYSKKEYAGIREFLNYMKGCFGKCVDSNDKKVLNSIFYYEGFSLERGKKVAYWLVDELHLGACPYCNSNYTYSVIGKNRSIRPAFDHYIPKSTYPHLRVCLFNLIPICNTCNSLKGYDDIEVIYPYEECFEDGDSEWSFMIIPIREAERVWKREVYEFQIELVNQKTEKKTLNEHDARVENSINTFGLNYVYTHCHKDEIRLLIQSYYEYNRAYEENLRNTLPEIYNKFYAKKDHLYFAFLEEDKWGRSPLNKLKRDLLKQFDIEYLNTDYDEFWRWISLLSGYQNGG